MIRLGNAEYGSFDDGKGKVNVFLIVSCDKEYPDRGICHIGIRYKYIIAKLQTKNFGSQFI